MGHASNPHAEKSTERHTGKGEKMPKVKGPFLFGLWLLFPNYLFADQGGVSPNQSEVKKIVGRMQRRAMIFCYVTPFSNFGTTL